MDPLAPRSAVAYDRFDPSTSGLRALFESDEVLAFVARVLGRSPLFRYRR